MRRLGNAPSDFGVARLRRPIATMKTSSILFNSALPFLGAAAFLASSQPAAAVIEGSWKALPSFDIHTTTTGTTFPNHTIALMEGPRYAYFLVHGQFFQHDYYSNGYKTYAGQNVAAPRLYRTDNLEPQSPSSPARFTAVADLPGVSGTTVSMAAYNGPRGYLAVAYADGGIDIILDSGEVETYTDFQQLSVPGSGAISSITFDPDGNRIYFSGRFGFFKLDLEKGGLTDICLSQQPVDFASRVGDRLVISMGNNVWDAPEEEGWKSIHSFHPLQFDREKTQLTTSTSQSEKDKYWNLFNDANGMRKATDMMALNDGTLLALVQVDNGSSRYLGVLCPGEDGKWNAICAGGFYANWEPMQFGLHGLYRGFMSLCEKGVMVRSNTNYSIFDRTVTPDFSVSNRIGTYTNKARTLVNTERVLDESNKALNTWPSNDNMRMATYNGSDCWFYRPFKGWERRHYDAETKGWSFLAKAGMPEGSVVGLTNNLAWHSSTGLMVRTPRSSAVLEAVTAPDIMSVRKDGKWTDLSASNSLPTTYMAAMQAPDGLAVDPNSPNYVWNGGTFTGLVRRNLNDPTDVVMFADAGAGSKSANLPCHVDAFPEQLKWKGCCDVYTPTFDAEGNLWFGYREFDLSQNALGFWSAADIKASENAAANPDSFRPLSLATIPGTAPNSTLLVRPCNHPSNKGYVVIADKHDENTIFLASTAGEGESPQNPRFVKRTHLVDDNGSKMETEYFTCFYEDPASGRFFAGHSEGLFWFYPWEMGQGSHLVHRVEFQSAHGVAKTISPLQGVRVQCMAPDTFGRIWIGLEGGGVVCISSDGKQLLGQYTARETPMTVDIVYGAAWDGSTNSLVVSTPEGLFEFTPYESATALDPSSVGIWPSTVVPDYNGYVSITGIPATESLSVVTPSGSTVALAKGKDGMIQWDLKTADGRRATGGEYKIVDSTGAELGRVKVY